MLILPFISFLIVIGVNTAIVVIPQWRKRRAADRTSLPKMSLRQALLLSSSNCHGYGLLEFAKEEICSFLKKHNVKDLIFIPYAQNDYNTYTAKMKAAIDPWGINVTSLHTYPDPANAINSSHAIFVGGGNTFLLLTRLYEKGLVSLIRKRVHEGHLLYIGSSAGTNVATKSIHTTNDMPIIYPPSFEAIGIVPFNINPHYIDVIESATHKGETREQRIREYLEMSHAAPVLGLREGAILKIDKDCLILKGVAGAVLFQKNDKKTEYAAGEDVSFLLNSTKDMN
ncbi:probable alpha-aspartyl dipeptidase [Pectinophora gossypiella]|uniref:probable alpha-aspartyl dipeptidase n=1 Tax=Pectinophora gossypiella TaxID=13191 RepID=UPI00214F511D|nr:probable alpha-aspartyl dipeptidase [Pectinophora gossypiella]